MIRFVRQFRRRLLAENRFSKYLLYALGEIALVMIGILLALRVNNWNELQKDRVRELEYLKLLTEEFERDSLSLSRVAQLTGSKVTQGKNLLPLLSSEEPLPDSVAFVYHAFLVGRGGSFNPYIPSYQKLLSTGDVSTIQNGEITSLIARYLDRMEEFESFIYSEGEHRRIAYNEYLHHYFSALIMPEIWNGGRDNMLDVNGLKKLGADISGFRENPLSAYHIQNVSAVNAELNLLFEQSMQRYVVPTLDLLRNELERLEKQVQ